MTICVQTEWKFILSSIYFIDYKLTRFFLFIVIIIIGIAISAFDE